MDRTDRMTRSTDRAGMRNRDLQDQLRRVDFAIYETALYLDAHPHSAEALTYYHKLMDTRRALLAEYEAGGNPVTIFGNTNKSAWDWVNAPWPWQ